MLLKFELLWIESKNFKRGFCQYLQFSLFQLKALLRFFEYNISNSLHLPESIKNIFLHFKNNRDILGVLLIKKVKSKSTQMAERQILQIKNPFIDDFFHTILYVL